MTFPRFPHRSVVGKEHQNAVFYDRGFLQKNLLNDNASTFVS